MTDLSQVMKPVAEARGLPNGHYVDPAIWALERERVLFDSWAGIGFAHEVPEPGDAWPVEFLGVPLLLVRDHEGAVRVFQNTCRHRGMILVESPRNIRGTIRCPYHSWCYGLDGRLRSTPHVGGPGQNIHPEIRRNELGLVEIPSRVWMGVVFANVSGRAEPFESVHGALMDRWAEFDRPLYHSGADSSFSLEVAGNWKLAVENYCESYHLPWVHPGLNSYSRLEDHYNIEEPGKFSGQGTLVYRQLEETGRRFPDFEGLSEKWNTGAEYTALFPNVLLGVHRDHAYAILLEPKELARTTERIAIFYATPEAAGPEFADLRARNTAQWRTVFEEDVFVVEGMQKGRHAPHFDGGKFSPAMDGPTHCFHDWVARRCAGG